MTYNSKLLRAPLDLARERQQTVAWFCLFPDNHTTHRTATCFARGVNRIRYSQSLDGDE